MISPGRGTVVVQSLSAVIQWTDTDRWTPVFRLRALQAMKRRRRRPIWHKTPVGRALFLPREGLV